MIDGYIRKEDAINALEEKEHEPWYLHKDLEWISGVVEAKDEIKAIEPADVVQVVHAHWIQTSTEDENGNAYYYCSNCGCGESHNPIVEVPYCWKCGAKMDAQGEE